MFDKVDEKGFFSEISALKTVPADKKSKCRTCAEWCQTPFKLYIPANASQERKFLKNIS